MAVAEEQADGVADGSMNLTSAPADDFVLRLEGMAQRHGDTPQEREELMEWPSVPPKSSCAPSQMMSSAATSQRAETILISQTHTLDAIFNELARLAALNMREYLGRCRNLHAPRLKAQSQCRSTLEALTEIKNPKPIAFAQQANIVHGPHQVNNGTAPPPAEPSRAGESENPLNKLLESRDGERLDTGEAGAAGRADTAMEIVGASTGPRQASGRALVGSNAYKGRIRNVLRLLAKSLPISRVQNPKTANI